MESGVKHQVLKAVLVAILALTAHTAPKKGGRASAPGATKGNRKRGGRKQRVIESY